MTDKSTTEKESARWADRLEWVHRKYDVDGSGTESGDALDVIEAEIEQALGVEREHAVLDFAEKILHGDEQHRAWLKEAAQAYCDGLPIPESRLAAHAEREVPENAVELAYRRALEQIIRDENCDPVQVAHEAITPYTDWVGVSEVEAAAINRAALTPSPAGPDALAEAAQALIEDVRRRYPDEPLQCPYMIALAAALRSRPAQGDSRDAERYRAQRKLAYDKMLPLPKGYEDFTREKHDKIHDEQADAAMSQQEPTKEKL